VLTEAALIAATALLAAGLSFFTGFGLGTLLLPVFALFLPAHVAVAATAVVHLANNLFKLLLVGRDADRQVALRFGLPAALAAIPGAALLPVLAALPPLFEGALGPLRVVVAPVGLTVGALMLLFALPFELPLPPGPRAQRTATALAGLLSGFFGGLSGHQGALRSAALVRMGLSRDAFIGTRAVCAVMVDGVRLSVYAASALVGGAVSPLALEPGQWRLVAVGAVAAFAGSFVGARLVKKTTLGWLRGIVAVALAVAGVALMLGLL